MVTQNPVREGMSLHDFLEAGEDQLFEFIDGARIYKVANIFGHGFLIKWLIRKFETYLDANVAGDVYQEVTYTINETSDWVRGSRIPDIMFFRSGRIQEYRAITPDWLNEPLRLVPNITIELVSPTERFGDIDRKVNADLANGVKVVWVIDMTTQVAYVHTLKGVTRVPADGTLTTDLLPDFGLSLPDLFATLSEA